MCKQEICVELMELWESFYNTLPEDRRALKVLNNMVTFQNKAIQLGANCECVACEVLDAIVAQVNGENPPDLH